MEDLEQNTSNDITDKPFGTENKDTSTQHIKDEAPQKKTVKKTFHIILHLIAAVILAAAAYGKFVGNPQVIEVFTALGMEPTGRYIIGVVEAIAAVFLLIPQMGAVGSLLGFSVLLGATLAHVTKIGFGMEKDGGVGLVLFLSTLIATGLILYIRRGEIPIFGKTMK